MRIEVDSNYKEVYIFLLKEEANNPSEELKNTIIEYKTKGYRIIKYISGDGDLEMAIKTLINFNIEK